MDFEKKYPAAKFTVVTVSMDDEWELINEYAKENKVTLRVLMGTEQVAQAYGGLDALPVTLLIDPSGRVAASHVGMVPREQYEKEILELVGK
jgi:peroxiredoxin